MANGFQQQSVRRKVTYFVLIIVLFTLTLVVRRNGTFGIEATANRLEVREENLGQVDLTSELLRLGMTGSRGAVICYFWYDAQEKQKKHEWNDLDQRIHLLSKLQPHFITPWLFQSWNLAYNVSVEFDRVKDKYFYVARGIGLLAEGERQNRDNPEMRFFIGNYTQSKIGISDENNTMRSLFEMSCMNPAERNPLRFYRDSNGRREFDYQQFEDFCQRHPHFVRRLRDHLRCKTPEDVVDFLASNQKIPSRYESPTDATASWDQSSVRFKPLEDRFPVLPPPFDTKEVAGYVDEKFADDNVGDDYDNYANSRGWYTYAQVPVDTGRYRRPLKMATIIFQGYPPRAQAYIGERLEQEGWFDAQGWEIRDWFPESADQPDGPKKPLAVGTGQNWAGDAWGRAYQMYVFHSTKNKLYLVRELKDLKLSQEEMRDLMHNRSVSNVEHHYYRSQAEQTPEAVAARKAFFAANQLRRRAEHRAAIAAYERPEAFGKPETWPKDRCTGWKRLMLRFPKFSHDLDQQEETYLSQYKYMSLLLQWRPGPTRDLLVVQDLLTGRALAPSAADLWLPLPVQLIPDTPLPFKYLPPFKGPLDDVDDDGKPFISPEAVSRAQSRIPGFAKPPPPKTEETPSPPPAPVPPAKS